MKVKLVKSNLNVANTNQASGEKKDALETY